MCSSTSEPEGLAPSRSLARLGPGSGSLPAQVIDLYPIPWDNHWRGYSAGYSNVDPCHPEFLAGMRLALRVFRDRERAYYWGPELDDAF